MATDWYRVAWRLAGNLEQLLAVAAEYTTPDREEETRVTKLLKKVVRATDARVGPSRPITVELVPPYWLVFREKGRRTSYTLSIQQGYIMAAKLEADRRLAARKAEKAARRKKR